MSSVTGKDIVSSFRQNLKNLNIIILFRLYEFTPHIKITEHGHIMMLMSFLANCMIPLMCHFMYMRKVTNTTDFLLSVYDVLIHIFPKVDVYNKLYETAISNVLRTAKRNQVIWNMQDIRGINPSIHSLQSVQNVLINIMPKYKFDGNLNIKFRYIGIYRLIDLFNCWKILKPYSLLWS